jgi:hypothetical protein
MAARFEVSLEIGSKRVFAGSLAWPGWCRHGRTEAEALEALLAYAPKYRAVLSGTRLGFTPPTTPAQLVVVERLKGNATTDFGAPGIPPAVDRDRACPEKDLRRLETILKAGWRAFDNAVETATGRELRKGPRGGGRSLEAIVAHVTEAEAGYLSAAGGKAPRDRAALRETVLATLRASAAGEIPVRGPRGGERWTARYFARRAAWHVISHAWEIERRLVAD